MASFTHVTHKRCAQLARELTAAGLDWHGNGYEDAPQFLTYFAAAPLRPYMADHPRHQRPAARIQPGAGLAGQLRSPASRSDHYSRAHLHAPLAAHVRSYQA